MHTTPQKDAGSSNPLHWFPEFLEIGRDRFRAEGRLLGSAILVGVVAGLGAVAFAAACHLVSWLALDQVAGYRAVGPVGEARLGWLADSTRGFQPWWLVLVPAVGGLLSGYLVFKFAPEAEGHGTDAAIAAYHHGQGRIRSRVPIIKLITSAITIGTGGSAGREGPIAQIGAGFGSLLATTLRLSVRERRILLACGMGAGVGAIFRAPLAGALFAAEILYCSPEFEPEVIIPAGLASAVAYCTFGLVFGWQPLFQTPPFAFDNPWQLGPYFLLAVVCAMMAMLYTRTFYGVHSLFKRLPCPRLLKPVLGACLTGTLGISLYFSLGREQAVLAVLSTGYGVLQEGLQNELAMSAGLLLAVAFGKILTTSLTIGSGGSGGVFGPAMVIGGCTGGAVGAWFHQIWPGLAPHPASFVIMGMAGFFAAAAKTPFSTLIIVSEMTGDYRLFLPALWVCAWSFLLSDRQSLYRSQVVSRSLSPAHQGDYVREVLAGQFVRQFLKPYKEVPALRPADPLQTVLSQLDLTGHTVLPVVDEERRLLGIVNLEEVHLAARSQHAQVMLLAADLMRDDVQPLQPDYGLDRALELFVQNNLQALPVVHDAADRRVVGIVRRSDISTAYVRRMHGEPR
ncbi:MAG: chloride channel protein [Candidatus Anammoximicrobium sp.]|nr:chloride channel protein [Candidatus Anammoximicrobium sp.]